MTDADGTNLQALTAHISNFQAGDLLAADTSGTSIVASYLNGLLTLSGEDTLANYQQVLRTITYHRADLPAATYKTILVRATDELGQSGFDATSNVFINLPPTVVVQSGANWEGVPKLLVPEAQVTDDATLISLSVWLATPVAGDVLSVTVGASGISANFDGTTLLLSGNKTAADYQQVLRTLTYHNINGSIPSQLGHLVSFQGVDHQGVFGNIDVLHLTTARLPEIDLNGPDEGLTYAGTWAGSPVSVASPAATFVNPDEVPLARVTASLSTTRPGDVLTADTTGTGLTATFSSSELRITGTGTSADYQQVLRTIKYHNTLGSTNVGQYTVNIRATLASFGSVVRSTLNIPSTITIASAKVDLNGPLSGTGFDSIWTGNGPSHIAAPDATLTSDLIPNLNAVIVTITNPQAGDLLSATPPGNISVSYNGSYEMVLNGIDSVANYEAALRSITYDSSVLTPNTLSRTINVVAHNGVSPGPTAIAKVTRAINNVASSKLYYRQSSWNTTIGQPGTHADDNAIAPDKTPYLPGSGPATFASISSYSRGINGLMIDVAGPVGSLSASDFVFKIGNNNAPSTWAVAPNPIVSVRAGAGVGGSNRVQLTWTANTISKTWLEITVLPTAKTGLADSYVLYWGSNPGNTGLGDISTRAMTNTTDELATRNNPSSSVPISSTLDFDRNKRVDVTDSLVARNNAGFIWKISIGVPVMTSAAAIVADDSPVNLSEIASAIAAHRAAPAVGVAEPVRHAPASAVGSEVPLPSRGLAMLPDVEAARARAKSVDRWIARDALEETALEMLLDDLLAHR